MLTDAVAFLGIFCSPFPLAKHLSVMYKIKVFMLFPQTLTSTFILQMIPIPI